MLEGNEVLCLVVEGVEHIIWKWNEVLHFRVLISIFCFYVNVVFGGCVPCTVINLFFYVYCPIGEFSNSYFLLLWGAKSVIKT